MPVQLIPFTSNGEASGCFAGTAGIAGLLQAYEFYWKAVEEGCEIRPEELGSSVDNQGIMRVYGVRCSCAGLLFVRF
jgi:hypothetical protein